jgi:preprotein translocase subunit YajC
MNLLLDSFFESYGLLIILLVVFVVFMVYYYMRNKKYQDATKQFQTSLKVGDKVKTYSGFYGTVEKITDTTDGLVVTLRLGENATVDIDINAIYALDAKNEVTKEPQTEVAEDGSAENEASDGTQNEVASSESEENKIDEVELDNKENK